MVAAVNERGKQMAAVKPRGKVPKEASVDEIIEIKTLLRHPMHSGRMKDADGKTIPRQIIKNFMVTFNGALIFSVDIEPSISSNPYIVFPYKAKESGTFEFVWTEDTGTKFKMEKTIKVS